MFILNRWVNRKDPSGKNIFGGGFLGLDNIGEKFMNITHLSKNRNWPWITFGNLDYINPLIRYS